MPIHPRMRPLGTLRLRRLAPLALALAVAGFLLTVPPFGVAGPLADTLDRRGPVRGQLGLAPVRSLFTVANAAPGTEVTRQLVVRNSGRSAARVKLRIRVRGFRPLADRLVVQVTRRGKTVHEGTLADFRRRALSVVGPRRRHVYHVRLSFPAGAGVLETNALQGTSVTFRLSVSGRVV